MLDGDSERVVRGRIVDLYSGTEFPLLCFNVIPRLETSSVFFSRHDQCLSNEADGHFRERKMSRVRPLSTCHRLSARCKIDRINRQAYGECHLVYCLSKFDE